MSAELPVVMSAEMAQMGLAAPAASRRAGAGAPPGLAPLTLTL